MIYIELHGHIIDVEHVARSKIRTSDIIHSYTHYDSLSIASSDLGRTLNSMIDICAVRSIYLLLSMAPSP